MDNILTNLFSNITNTTKQTSITNVSSNYSKQEMKYIYPTPGLNQGNKFKKYQKKISKNLEKDMYKVNSKEGFNNLDNTKSNNQSNQSNQRNQNSQELFKETNNVIQQTDYSKQNDSINTLKQQYNDALGQYNNLLNQIKNTSEKYFERVNPQNPYLGKNVCLSNGACGYVTEKGVFKWYPADNNYTYNSTAGKNGCPSSAYIQITGEGDYNVPGSMINSTPPLIVGTPMVAGQSCGNEGSNIYVDKLLSNPSVQYEGCYQDNATSPTMTFIGGAPSSGFSGLQNGNFSQPVIATNSYQYITSSSTVPGWTFNNGVLLNQSSAWGYPMPYPSGDQCVSIQMTASISQTINLSAGTSYTLTFSACGRNCCDGSGQANPINIFLNLNTTSSTNNQIYTFTPGINNWTNLSTNFTVQTSGNYSLVFQGTWSQGDRSTAMQNIQISGSGTSNSSENGVYSYETCKQAAIESGYQYFALQSVNPSTGLGYCGASNSQPAVTQYGTSYVPTGQVALWNSNTGGQSGNSATLTAGGSLSVLNSSGTSVYATDTTSATPTNFLGCYNDCSKGRGLPDPVATGTQAGYDYDKCSAAAAQNGYTYFGLQFTQSSGTSECWLGNDIDLARSMGKASNCTIVNNGPVGGGCSNAVYTTSSSINFYYLILQDDGNMCIYRGTGPNDNQGLIWASGTNGKQQKPNPNYQASAGKYGQNWIPSGSTLAAGDFVGSTDGSIYLIMQTDGNLVLYTSKNVLNCSKMSDGNTGGGSYANALYNIGKQAIFGNLGQLAYVDPNAEVHIYDSTNTTYNTEYSKFPGNNPGNDISGAMYGNATVDQCKTTCNSLEGCAGFVFDNNNNVCWPKNSNIYPTSELTPNTDNNNNSTYIRSKVPKSTPIGVPKKTKNIDTITYQNYANGGSFADKYGLAKVTSVQQQQLEQLESTMSMLSNKMVQLTGNYMNSGQLANNQLDKNRSGLGNYLNELKNTEETIKVFPQDNSSILQDSDIVVLQKNYEYLFWSTLALGVTLVSMNVVKK
jgi:hypothetical protein